MSNLIRFSARGTEFKIPLLQLERRTESMLYMLATTDPNIPIDKINDAIYIDIDPFHINEIAEFYTMNIIPNFNKNIYLYMDFKYLGLTNDDTIVPKCMTIPIINNNILKMECNIEQKYCKMHTIDNEITIVDLATCNTDNWNNLLSILYGQDEEYVMEKSEEYINVWIGITKKRLNNLLSIIRDGLNWYYIYLIEGNKQFKVNMNKDNKILNSIISQDNYECSIFDLEYCKCYNCRIYGSRNNYYNKCEKCKEEYKDYISEENYNKKLFCDPEQKDNKMMPAQFILNTDIIDNMKDTTILINKLNNKINYNYKENKKIMKYLDFYNMCDTNTKKQLEERIKRYPILSEHSFMFDVIDSNYKIFMENEYGTNECIINKYSERYDIIDTLYKNCKKFKRLLEPHYCTARSSDIIIKNMNAQLNDTLSICAMEYIYGL